MPESWHLADLTRYAPLLGKGVLMTLALSTTVMLAAMLLGLLVAVIRHQRTPVLSSVCDGAVYVIRSMPCVMLIALVHFGILPVFTFQNVFWGSAFVGLGLYTTAYLAEIFRGGFAAIHPEEAEAATSLGLSRIQRYVYVLLPLVILRMMPALVNQFVTLIKDTSLASMIGVIELTRAAEIISEQTLHELTLLTFVAVVYFGLCYGLSKWGEHLQVVRT